MRLEAGEVVVFTKGDPHVMSSAPGMRAEPVTTAEPSTQRPPGRSRSSGDVTAR